MTDDASVLKQIRSNAALVGAVTTVDTAQNRFSERETFLHFVLQQ